MAFAAQNQVYILFYSKASISQIDLLKWAIQTENAGLSKDGWTPFTRLSQHTQTRYVFTDLNL